MSKTVSATHVQARVKAAGVHLGLSFLVALLSALCVFGLWFPYPYPELAGGRELFILVISVDVVCGPMLTFVVFSLAKPRKELVRDLCVIAFVQFGALVYGIHVVAQARPVLLVFEVDRFRVVTAVDVDFEKLQNALPEMRSLSLTGPKTIGVRVPVSSDSDYIESLDMSLAGIDAALRPPNWRVYDEQRAAVLKKAKGLAQLRQMHPDQLATIATALAATGMSEGAIGFLPMVSRRSSSWVTLVDLANANVVGFAPVDGF